MEENAKFMQSDGQIYIDLPLTRPTGKIRVKERSFFSEYGIPFATRKNKISTKNYVEWQIGYDLEDNKENTNKTRLSSFQFLNNKGVKKIPYELSELLFFSCKNNLIDISEIKKVYQEIKSIPDNKLIDALDEMQITRTDPIKTKINGMEYYKMRVSYPLIVYKFAGYDIYAEVINREKQRAVGIQPMLYVCLPITSLDFIQNPIGRVLNAKESGKWIIGKNEAKLSLELFKIFGMLSEKHRGDILSIFKVLFGF